MSNKEKLKKYYLFFMLLASDVPLLFSVINCSYTRLINKYKQPSFLIKLNFKANCLMFS